MKYKQLSLEQRYEISAFLKAGMSKKEIAKRIGVSLSTLYREIARNGKPKSYNAADAHRAAMRRRDRLRCPRKYTHAMKREVHKLIREKQWSPKQICGYYKANGMDMVSHETIYADIRFDKKNGGDLWTNTRFRMKHRDRTLYAYKTPIPDRRDIDERPAEADGSRFGDFEMDLIIGANGKQAILTLIDRYTNMGFIRKLKKGKDADEVADTVYKTLLPYKRHLKTITTDNGPEFAKHLKITELLGVKVYFAKPYHSWEKGGIENFNLLVRQYLPKGTDFDLYTDDMIMDFQKKLNDRPREKLNFKTPKTVFYQFCR